MRITPTHALIYKVRCPLCHSPEGVACKYPNKQEGGYRWAKPHKVRKEAAEAKALLKEARTKLTEEIVHD